MEVKSVGKFCFIRVDDEVPQDGGAKQHSDTKSIQRMYFEKHLRVIFCSFSTQYFKFTMTTAITTDIYVCMHTYMYVNIIYTPENLQMRSNCEVTVHADIP